MKFTTVFSVLAVAVAAVGATETNANRLARGLPPNPPVRRHPSSTYGAKHGRPSGVPPSYQCNVGSMQCCNSVTHSSDAVAGTIAKLLGIVLPADVAVGLTCSPLSVIGVGGGSHCNAQPVCCENNEFKGLIAIGCTPINISA